MPSGVNVLVVSLAAGLMWLDQRVALVFMFGVIMYSFDYSRAVMRVTHAEMEIWLRTLAAELKVDIPDERAKEITAWLKSQTPEHIWASLRRDWQRVHAVGRHDG
jgi:hypothetical protein